MKIRSSWALLAALAAWGCGGGDSEGGAMPASGAADRATENAAAGGEYSRESFVLCEAIEAHREELAGVVGFEPDLEREVQGIGSQCFVRGTDFGWLSVELPPAITLSIAWHVRAFDEETIPCPRWARTSPGGG